MPAFRPGRATDQLGTAAQRKLMDAPLQHGQRSALNHNKPIYAAAAPNNGYERGRPLEQRCVVTPAND
eukprot:1349274-Lingulodinium_polyedra.AAC.1